MWEIFEGKKPYIDELQKWGGNAEKVIKAILNGLRLTTTNRGEPKIIYNLMENCWVEKPNRPELPELYESLQEILGSNNNNFNYAVTVKNTNV
jgi:hypothetical protein